MKSTAILPVLVFLVFTSCLTSQPITQTYSNLDNDYAKRPFYIDSIPPIAPQLPPYQAWIYNPTDEVVRLCKYIPEEGFAVWEEIYPGNATVSLNDCGRGPHTVCPYRFYVYTANKATDNIMSEAKGRYRMFYHSRLGFQIETYKR